MTTQLHIKVYSNEQKLTVLVDGVTHTYLISTASEGVGQQMGSLQTPLGAHRICAKIGEGLPLNSVFRGRRWTGEVWTADLGACFPGRDWVLTRILWLQGLDPGLNRGGSVDSKRRYIYIHGTNEENRLGSPASHGCVRMANKDVVALFNLVAVNDLVLIV